MTPEMTTCHFKEKYMNILKQECLGSCGLIKIVEELESRGFHDRLNRSIEKNPAFQALKELAQEQLENYDGPPDGEAWSGGIADNH